MTEYRTIIADPPWTPALNAGSPSHKAGPQRQYKTLGVPEIISLRPPAAKQAHLWLWVLTQHVDWGYLVARTWGFEPWTMLTWCKPGLGVGRFQCNTEHVLLCRKGTRHGNPFGSTGGTWFTWPRGQRHSAKSTRWRRLRDCGAQLTSIVSLPLDTFPGVEFHAEILIFNVKGVRPHYFLPETAL